VDQVGNFDKNGLMKKKFVEKQKLKKDIVDLKALDKTMIIFINQGPQF
jgi:hypothetical protein